MIPVATGLIDDEFAPSTVRASAPSPAHGAGALLVYAADSATPDGLQQHRRQREILLVATNSISHPGITVTDKDPPLHLLGHGEETRGSARNLARASATTSRMGSCGGNCADLRATGHRTRASAAGSSLYTVPVIGGEPTAVEQTFPAEDGGAGAGSVADAGPMGFRGSRVRIPPSRFVERQLPQGFEPWGSSLLRTLTPILFRPIPILWG